MLSALLATTGERSLSQGTELLSVPSANGRLPSRPIVVSGPTDVRLMVRHLPSRGERVPIAAYFHESQWTYPAKSLDRIPHLVSHLETLELCDAAWFNSDFHRQSFLGSAWDHPSPTVRSLAREILPAHAQSQSRLSPVRVGRHPINRSHEFTIAWSARWEREKRPDIMLAVVRHLLDTGMQPPSPYPRSSSSSMAGSTPYRPVNSICHPSEFWISAKEDYELALANSDVWLSTTEHEYYGVSAIEATLLGALPVVPLDLAYRETLPSAIGYPPGDIVLQPNGSRRSTSDPDRYAVLVDWMPNASCRKPRSALRCGDHP